MSTPENARRILARKIVDALFTSLDRKADRIELKVKAPKHFRVDANGEITIGGLCPEAAIDQVERVLKEQ